MRSRLRLRLFSTLTVLAGLLFLMQSQASAAEPIFGEWLTDDGAAIVRIDSCGGKLCGVIERVLDPDAPANDINNRDARLRSNPLVGTFVLSGFVRSGARWKDGRAYDPKVGKSYRSKLEVLEDGTLKVTGCILFLCQSRYWTHPD